MELVLMEDDCAPDAREYFEKKLYDLLGWTIREFQDEAGPPTISDDELHMEWSVHNWVLSYDGDDPYYKLHRESLTTAEQTGVCDGTDMTDGGDV